MARRIFDTPLFATLIIAVIYAGYGALLLHQSHEDITRFIMAGDKFTQAAQTPIRIKVNPHSDGYDGQFYFRLALDPLTRHRTAFGITLDFPAYRQQRILYPIVAYLLALGRPAWTPAALVLVNYLAICLMAFISSRYAQSLGRHALWGASVPLYAGFFISFTGNLTEITENTLLIVALLALLRRRSGWAALFFSLAVLARETALLAVIGVGASYLYTHRQAGLRRSAIVLAVPVLVCLLWQLILIDRWGQSSGATGVANLGVPLAGLIAFLEETFNGFGYFVQLLWVTEIIVMFAFMAVVLYLLRTSHTDRGIKLAWLLYLCSILFLTTLVWVNDWAFMRVMSECYVMGAIIVFGSARRLGSTLLSVQIAVGLVVALYTAFAPY